MVKHDWFDGGAAGKQKLKAAMPKTEMARLEPVRKAGFSRCRASRISDLTQRRKVAKSQRIFPFFASLRLGVFALDSLCRLHGWLILTITPSLQHSIGFVEENRPK